MFDKVAAAFSVVALGAAGYSVFQIGKMSSTVSQNAAAVAAGGGSGTAAVVDAAAIEKYMAENPVSDKIIEAYLRDHPEVMIASLEKFQVDQRGISYPRPGIDLGGARGAGLGDAIWRGQV